MPWQAFGQVGPKGTLETVEQMPARKLRTSGLQECRDRPTDACG